LSKLFRKLKWFPVIKKWLKQGSATEKLYAVQAYALLEPSDPDIWFLLVQNLKHTDRLYALKSAEALMKINSMKAIPLILDAYMNRLDWAPNYVSHILFSVSSPKIIERIVQHLETTFEKTGKLPIVWIQLLKCSKSLQVESLINRVLIQNEDAETELACL